MSKRAFVTGACGFIGSHLVENLLSKGWRVKALIWYNSRSNWGWLEELRGRKDSGLEVLLGDVTDPYQMDKAAAGYDFIFHLAALIGIPYSYNAPYSYLRTNVNGTLNLLQAALHQGIARFIHVSTSEVYGTARYVPIDEEHPLQSQSPYSASKIAADKLVESFYCSFKLPVVTVRPFNTYGPRQSARAIVPTIISQALQSKAIRLGSLDPVRDLTFVDDTVEGLIAAASTDLIEGQVLNLGSSKGVSINTLAQIIFEIIGGDFEITQEDARVRPSRSEVMELVSNNNRARKVMGWQPTVSLREGLERTVDWFHAHQDSYQSEEYAV
jgi:NAD dependent epimerase/dehydratase